MTRLDGGVVCSSLTIAYNSLAPAAWACSLSSSKNHAKAWVVVVQLFFSDEVTMALEELVVRFKLAVTAVVDEGSGRKLAYASAFPKHQ